MEGDDLAGPDLFGKLRSGEAKAAAGEEKASAATSRDGGRGEERGTVKFSFRPHRLNPVFARATGTTGP